MMLRVHAGGSALFFLAAALSGVHLSSSDPELQVQMYQPVLQPSESAPPTGTYMLENGVGKPCIKATMGAEYVVTEKKETWFFNLDPSRVRTGGHCGKEAAVLSLMLPDNRTGLQFSFRKEDNIFYVDKLTAYVSPVCPRCANKTYSGFLASDKIFSAADGQSFKCKSENVFSMSPELRIKLVPVQIQAFTLPKSGFGEVVECWADYNKRVIPIILGAIVVGVILIPVLTSLFIKDRRRQGYDRL